MATERKKQQDRERMQQKRADDAYRLYHLNDLVSFMMENDPDEVVADGGVTMLDVWRQQAKAYLSKPKT